MAQINCNISLGRSKFNSNQLKTKIILHRYSNSKIFILVYDNISASKLFSILISLKNLDYN